MCRSRPLFSLPRFWTAPANRFQVTLQRLGCDDSLVTSALVWELKLRRPELFPKNAAPGKGAVVLISEWDTLYGRAIPHSFEKAFIEQGGSY